MSDDTNRIQRVVKMANVKLATMMKHQTTKMLQELKEELEDPMETRGVPRLIKVRIKPQEEKSDSEDESAFFNSSEEDWSSEDSSDEDEDSDSETEAVPHLSPFYYLPKWYGKKEIQGFLQSKNISEEDKLIALIRSQVPEDLWPDDFPKKVETKQDHTSTRSSLLNQEWRKYLK